MKRHVIRRQGGFTLIELLIVVAIIAILAAIAVPNFLEAQTRAKVSRTYADMRSVATAMESYVIDWNSYVPMHFPSGTSEAFGNTGVTVHATYRTILPRIARYIPLTTPISYMTSMPEDVFTDAQTPENQYWRSTERDSWFDHVTSSTLYNNFYAQNTAIKWVLRSPGPSRAELDMDFDTFPSGFGVEDTYDPTNGTISAGNVSYAGPGDGIVGD